MIRIRFDVRSVQTNADGPNIIIYCHNFIQGYDISTFRLNQFLNMATLIRLTINTYNDHLDFGITIHERMCFTQLFCVRYIQTFELLIQVKDMTRVCDSGKLNFCFICLHKNIFFFFIFGFLKITNGNT